MSTELQIVAGLFYQGEAFRKALSEFRWSIRQNGDFWKNAVLYCDAEAWEYVREHASGFREVVVDRDLPPHVAGSRKWACKAWWPVRALERFPEILYCDFDIWVRRQPDAELEARLNRSPLFLYMPNYGTARKVVGCGVVYYTRQAPMDAFAKLVYDKWNCDERAWTEMLGLSREEFLRTDHHFTPDIVDYTYLLANPDDRAKPYIIHGISGVDDGYNRLRRVGYANGEIRFVHPTFGRIRSAFRSVMGWSR